MPDELAILGEPVNRVIEVELDGDDATFAIYDLPAGRALARLDHPDAGSINSPVRR